MIDQARQQYLNNEVLSASPQKLRKLLLEGAVRFAHRTIALWQHQDFEAGLETSNRTRDILVELLVTIKEVPENQPLLDLYRFLNREVHVASFERSTERMQQLIRVLEIELETWTQVCQQLAAGPTTPDSNGASPCYPAVAHFDRPTPGTFNFEA